MDLLVPRNIRHHRLAKAARSGKQAERLPIDVSSVVFRVCKAVFKVLAGQIMEMVASVSRQPVIPA